MRHELKTIPKYYKDALSGFKTFEVRYNDRNYQIGDTLILREYNPDVQRYTGRWHEETVGYILSDPHYVKEGFVILGFA